MSRQSTLNVSLTGKLRKYVDSKLKTGSYESASEVIRESLRALQERDQAAAEFWAGVREKVAVARRQVVQGRTRDGERVMDDILANVSTGHQRPASAMDPSPSPASGKFTSRGARRRKRSQPAAR